MWPFNEPKEAADPSPYRSKIYLPIADKRLKDGFIAVCPKGHRQKSITRLTLPYPQPFVEVCVECYLNFIAANVPEVKIVEKKGNNENAD